MDPEVSVVVPSHDRPVRLRRLLDALEQQSLAPDRWELVVVHDSAGPETDEVLRTHSLARSERLRWRRLPAGSGKPGHQRNVGWRLARAPLVAFTDDDCRPVAGWLDALLAAARADPGAIVQGRIKPDPLEADVLLAPHARTLEEDDPPGPFAQTANVLYPREALERADGFVESVQLTSGEDTDLALRVRALGYGYVGAREALVYHAVDALGLRGALRVTRKWADLAYIAREHQEVRETLYRGIFWRESHALFLLGLAGLALAPRQPVAALAVAPWLRFQLGERRRPSEVLRWARRVPGLAVVEAAEIVTCVRGSLRHRTLFL